MTNTQIAAKIWVLAGLFLTTCMPSKKATFTPITDSDSTALPAIDSTVHNPVPEPPQPDPRDQFFLDLFAGHPGVFDDIVQQKDALNVQIIYTQINRDASNKPHFTTHQFHTYDAKYHYPASTVKFPIALLSLQKINDLRLDGFDKYSTMITESDADYLTAVYNDPTTAQGKPNIAQYIKKIFLASDNDAANRLYEFLGQDYLNDQLRDKGYLQSQILHRLSSPLTALQNKHSNPILFYNPAGKLLFEQASKTAENIYPKRHDFLGKAYIQDGNMIEKPMNFSEKNRLPLEELHEMFKSFIFPATVSEEKRFRMSEENRRFVLQYMSEYPSESHSPVYPENYPDGSVKFILLGAGERTLLKSVRIFNKSGIAYGQLTDVAYVVDFERNIEFILSATLLCNADGIINDDHYDYETIGFPFMKELGMAVYQYEAKRKKANTPDLSEFKLNYD